MPSPLIAKPRLKTMHRRREAIIRMRGFSESNGVIEGGAAARRTGDNSLSAASVISLPIACACRRSRRERGSEPALFFCARSEKKETRDISPISSIS